MILLENALIFIILYNILLLSIFFVRGWTPDFKKGHFNFVHFSKVNILSHKNIFDGNNQLKNKWKWQHLLGKFTFQKHVNFGRFLWDFREISIFSEKCPFWKRSILKMSILKKKHFENVHFEKVAAFPLIYLKKIDVGFINFIYTIKIY